MFSIIYILKFPTFYKNLCEYHCSQLSPHKFFWKIYFKMLSWYELAIPISYATSSTFSFLHNIVRSLKRNLDDFQVHLLDELRILAYLRKTLLESSEIFVEHARQVARIWFRTQACPCGAVGSAMSIGLSINGCSHSKKAVWPERTRLTSPKIWAAVT